MTDKQAAIEALDESPSLELFNVILELLEHAEEQPLKDILNNIDNIEGRIETIRAALQSKPVDVDEGYFIDKAMYEFLLGEGSIDDMWFGDALHDGKYTKRYWWRTKLRETAKGYLNTPQWQPIETAPRDGMEYVFYWHYYYPGDDAPTHGVTHGFWNKDKDYFEYDDEEVGPNVISHWAHMPRTEDTE